jgi:hypothetical protein
MKSEKKRDPLNILEENLNEKEVKEEVEQYKKEKEKIRKLLDSISNTNNGILNKVMDYGFILLLILLVFARFVFGIVDNILSLELGLLLLSIKIIWLIKIQNNYNHFIFMIMHTLDHHQMKILEELKEIEKKMETEK